MLCMHRCLPPQARDVERRKEQEQGAAILQQQLVERQAQRIREEELRDQVRPTDRTRSGQGTSWPGCAEAFFPRLTCDPAATAGRRACMHSCPSISGNLTVSWL